MSLSKTLTLATLAMLLVATMAGCGRAHRAHKSASSTTANTTWEVAIDLSKSTMAQRPAYLEALRRILTALRPGDAITIFAIQQASIADAHYLYQGTIPRFVFNPDPTPTTDNQLVLSTYRATEQRRYAAEQARFDDSHNLATELGAICAQIAPSVLHEDVQSTDIFGALQLAGYLFSASGGVRRLVLLSDGLECDGQLNFAQTPPSDALMAHLATTQRCRGELPNLHDAQVLIVGPGRNDPAGYARLCHSWSDYIDRYTHGDLQARFFQSALSDQLLAAWMAHDHGS